MANVVTILTERLLEVKKNYREAYLVEKELMLEHYSIYPRGPLPDNLRGALTYSYYLNRKITALECLICDIQINDIPDAVNRRKDATIAWARLRRK